MLNSYTVVGCIAALSAVVHAQNIFQSPPSIFTRVNTPFNFDNCIEPAAMEKCWNIQDYISQRRDPTCADMQNRIECALTNCWNRVYSCDYQQLLLSYSVNCSDEEGLTLDLPFYPAPDDAAGQCSCNISKVADTLLAFNEPYETCTHMEPSTADCDCCWYGVVAAALWDTCPDQDPAYIALDYVQSFINNNNNYNNNSISLAQCSARLQKFSCEDHGFKAYGKDAIDYAKPTPLHSATSTWRDTNGALISPVSGATYAWTGWNMTLNATATAFTPARIATSAWTGWNTTANVTAVVTVKSTVYVDVTLHASNFALERRHVPTRVHYSHTTKNKVSRTTTTTTHATHNSTGAAPMAAAQTAAALLGLGGFALAALL